VRVEGCQVVRRPDAEKKASHILPEASPSSGAVDRIGEVEAVKRDHAFGTTARVTTVILALWGASAACSGASGAPAQAGSEGGDCYPNGTCNSGLSCFSNICANENPDRSPNRSSSSGSSSGGSSGSSSGAVSDGGRGDGAVNGVNGDGAPCTWSVTGPDANCNCSGAPVDTYSSCISNCPDTTVTGPGVYCGGTCVNTQDDPNNCGTCGLACNCIHNAGHAPSKLSCKMGVCDPAACSAGGPGSSSSSGSSRSGGGGSGSSSGGGGGGGGSGSSGGGGSAGSSGAGGSSSGGRRSGLPFDAGRD
jgi:hypothetical protein